MPRSLLESGGLRKYLVYSIGEILLVVIGILIALQINNWNEAKKDAATAAHILHEILNNLKEDASQLINTVERREKAKTGVENLLESITTTPEAPILSMTLLP